MTTNLSTISAQYSDVGIGQLTSQEEIYVQRRAQGLNPTAAARSANYENPVKAVAMLSQREDVNMAIAYAREMQRQIAIGAGSIDFTKDDATLMYLEAHATSETTADKIRATDSLVKLHGLATPEKKEVVITNRGQLEVLDDEELLRIAGQDISLSPDDYMVADDE
ncbi:hypothetical protein [Shewanella gaetbuli]|uniref:Terminase small subunit n=1 Tax=Shewanella gaetbuli TaxID=220752 RepID=A0A9X2CLU2_9GAMM|nr:hypothetical protein [Shewanella gaetbuli]MCL1142970.1 hypothetical protein [Shewanella gaetbuli]